MKEGGAVFNVHQLQICNSVHNTTDSSWNSWYSGGSNKASHLILRQGWSIYIHVYACNQQHGRHIER